MIEKGLELNKTDFTINGYEVDKVKYPQHGSKEPSSSGKEKMKMGDAMMIDLLEEESDDNNDDLVQFG